MIERMVKVTARDLDKLERALDSDREPLTKIGEKMLSVVALARAYLHTRDHRDEEIARLRAALEKIASGQCGDVVTEINDLPHYVRVARTALRKDNAGNGE